MVIGFFSAFVVSALIYAVGQIAEDTSEIVYLLKMQRDENKTTADIVKEINSESEDKSTTREMLDAWFAEGLISEKEYLEKIKLFSKDDD